MTPAANPIPTRRARLAELAAGWDDAPAPQGVGDMTRGARAVGTGAL